MPDILLHPSEQEEEMRAQAKLGFSRKLASPNKCKREKAMSLLCLWLSSQKVVKEEELRKIWKGLFFCVWCADKSQTEADLIDRLASLMEKLSVDLSVQFFQAFLFTLRREWAQIDKLRMERFYLLLRKFIHHMFVLLESSGWEADLIRKFMTVLVESTFLSKDQFAADAMNFHLVDVFLRNLKKFSPITVETFEFLLEPFWVILSKGSDKALAKRTREKVFRVLFDLGFRTLRAQEDANDLDENVKRFGILALSMPISSKAFELAALPIIPQSNRKLLHEIHEEFATLERLKAEFGSPIVAPSSRTKSSNSEGGELRASHLTTANGDSNLEAKIGPVFSKRKGSVRTLRPEVKSRTSSLWFPKTADISTVNIEENENIPPGQVPKASEVKVSLKERLKQGRTEGKEPDKRSSTRKKQKCGKDRVLGASFPNICLERQSQVVENVEGCQGIEDIGSLDRSKQDNPSVFQPNAELTIWAVESKKLTAAGIDPVCDAEHENHGNSLTSDDSVVSNLTKRFDSIAAEESTDVDTYFSSEFLLPFGLSDPSTGSKNQKSSKNSPGTRYDGDDSGNMKGNRILSPGAPLIVSVGKASSGKKAKKVRFCLKQNLVWKPSTPLPPHVLRVPPSATPRGSALKKGVPPGPILILSEKSSPKPKKASSKKTPPSALQTPDSLKVSSRGSRITKKARHSPR